MARTVHLEIDQANSFSKEYVAKNADGTAINLSGYTIRSEAKKSFTTFAAFSFTATVIDAAAGRFTLSMTDIQTRDLPPGRMIYDVKLIDSEGFSTKLFEGIIHVYPAITDANPFITLEGTRISDPEVVHKHTNKIVLDRLTVPSQAMFAWKVVGDTSPSVYGVQNGDRLFVDTTNSQMTLVVPDIPEDNFAFEVQDLNDTMSLNNVIVIDESSPTVIATKNTPFKMVYLNGYGWKTLS